jgi:hypothetical protein
MFAERAFARRRFSPVKKSADIERPFLSALLRPLEKAICGNEATPPREAVLECGLLPDGLVASVNHFASDRQVLCPKRPEPPASHA